MIKLSDINPFLRFAGQFVYKSDDNPVKVTDCRIFYCVDGSADIFIENQHYILHKNSLFYCCGGSEYNIISTSGFEPICFNFDLTQSHCSQTMCLSPQSTLKGIPDMSVIYEEVGDCPLLNSHFCIHDANSFAPAMERILREYSDNGVFSRELCSSILKEQLIELYRYQTAVPSVVDKVMKYIDANYAENLKNSQLAALAGYHEYYLNRLFLAHTGNSMHHYLLKVRLNHARQLVLNQDIFLSAIPEKVGFNSYSHFSSYFKQFFGISPAEYRKNIKSGI